MPDEPAPRRLYSEKEISVILKRATEIQEEAGPPDAYGLSLEELQQIAAEAGIDPRYVMAAAAELERGGVKDKKRFHLLGAPLSMLSERVVEGEATEEKWEEVLAEIRRTFDLVGVTGQVGRSLEWTHTGRRQQVQVAVTSREGQTRIRIHQHYPKAALLTFLPPVMLAYLLFGILLGALNVVTLPLVAALFIGLLGAVFLAMRFAFSRVVRNKERKAGQLLDRLAGIFAAPTPAPLSSSEKEGPRLDAALLADEEPEESRVQARRRGKTAS